MERFFAFAQNDRILKVCSSGAITHEVAVILSHKAKDLLPRWGLGRKQLMQSAMQFVISLTRSILYNPKYDGKILRFRSE